MTRLVALTIASALVIAPTAYAGGPRGRRWLARSRGILWPCRVSIRLPRRLRLWDGGGPGIALLGLGAAAGALAYPYAYAPRQAIYPRPATRLRPRLIDDQYNNPRDPDQAGTRGEGICDGVRRDDGFADSFWVTCYRSRPTATCE
jgi:hypothetical protein